MSSAATDGKDHARHFQGSFYESESISGLFYASERILTKINTCTISTANLDGTFFCSPRPFVQVLICMAEFEGKALPVAVFLLPSKKQEVMKPFMMRCLTRPLVSLMCDVNPKSIP